MPLVARAKRLAVMNAYYHRTKILKPRKVLTEEERVQANRSKAKRYKERYPERVKEQAKRARVKGAERAKVTNAAWRAANPARVNQFEVRRKTKQLASPELMQRRRKQQRDYYARNAERRKQDVSTYVAKNRDKRKMWSRISMARRRANLKNNGGICTREQWLARCDFYGWRCAYCSIQLNLNTVEIEHVKPAHVGGTNWPANLVPACAQCNMKKHIKRWLPSWIQHRAAAFTRKSG